MIRVGLVLVVVLAGVVAVGAFALRPPISVPSAVDPDVTIECSAATSLAESACLARGDAILADGSPTTTFEAKNLVRLRLDRALLGFGDACRAEWFLGRYPEDVAWTQEIACEPA